MKTIYYKPAINRVLIMVNSQKLRGLFIEFSSIGVKPSFDPKLGPVASPSSEYAVLVTNSFRGHASVYCWLLGTSGFISAQRIR